MNSRSEDAERPKSRLRTAAPQPHAPHDAGQHGAGVAGGGAKAAVTQLLAQGGGDRLQEGGRGNVSGGLGRPRMAAQRCPILRGAPCRQTRHPARRGPPTCAA